MSTVDIFADFKVCIISRLLWNMVLVSRDVVVDRGNIRNYIPSNHH